jgi:putative tryptophan/tyrosine transport system substrate-binding protein
VDRRAFLGTLAGSILAAPLAAEAQQAGKIYRIGVISASSPSSDPNWEVFVEKLRELGYVPGQNVVIERRVGEGRSEISYAAAVELPQGKIDVIWVGGTPGALAVKRTTSTVPVVFIAVSDPLGSGLVASLSRPGGNITGLTHINKETHEKRVQLVKELIPRVSRIAVLAGPSGRLTLADTQAAAQALGLQVDVVEVRAADELEAAFSQAGRGSAQALVVLPDALFFAQRLRIGQLAATNRLPTVFELKGYVSVGGLMSYGADLSEQVRRSAVYVDRILKGAKPADLPVEQPTKFELVINLKTAKALGLTIPPSLLQRADQVIE